MVLRTPRSGRRQASPVTEVASEIRPASDGPRGCITCNELPKPHIDPLQRKAKKAEICDGHHTSGTPTPPNLANRRRRKPEDRSWQAIPLSFLASWVEPAKPRLRRFFSVEQY